MVLKSDDDDNGGDDISSQLGIHDGNMMLIMVHNNSYMRYMRYYCLAMRGQIVKKGILERRRAREDDYDMIRRNEILTRSLPGLRLQIRRLPPQTPPPYTALALGSVLHWQSLNLVEGGHSTL